MSPTSLDPELLRAFVAVADHLSFTRAAERLNRTQASVSLQVKRLERQLGVGLFRRSTAHVELTGSGGDFLVDARRILALNEQALARLSVRQLPGELRIGVMEDYGTKVLPGLIASAAERFPQVQIDMEIGLTGRMLKRLGTSFGLVIAMHAEGCLEGELLRRDEAVWATGPQGAAEEREPLPLALSYPDCLFRQWATRALSDAGLAWRLTFVSPSMAAVEAVVAHGLAITIFKRSMLPEGFRTIADRLPNLPPAEIRLHLADELSRSARLVADHIARGLKAHGG